MFVFTLLCYFVIGVAIGSVFGIVKALIDTRKKESK